MASTVSFKTGPCARAGTRIARRVAASQAVQGKAPLVATNASSELAPAPFTVVREDARGASVVANAAPKYNDPVGQARIKVIGCGGEFRPVPPRPKSA